MFALQNTSAQILRAHTWYDSVLFLSIIIYMMYLYNNIYIYVIHRYVDHVKIW